jgi:hypothetical protein
MIDRQYQGFLIQGNENTKYEAIIKLTPKLDWLIGINLKNNGNLISYSDWGSKGYYPKMDFVASFSIEGGDIYDLLITRHKIKHNITNLRNSARDRIDDSILLESIIDDGYSKKMVPETEILNLHQSISEFCSQCDKIFGDQIKNYIIQ